MSELSVNQLKEKAKSMGIKGYAQMNKAALIASISDYEAELSKNNQSSDKPEKKPVEISGQKSQDIKKEQNDDLQSHPKFAKFKPSGGK
jgi:hypothetical protein